MHVIRRLLPVLFLTWLLFLSHLAQTTAQTGFPYDTIPDNPGAPPSDARVYLPLVSSPTSRVVIGAAHIDSSLSGEGDEALLVQNVGYRAQPLAGWAIRAGGRTAIFPETTGVVLAPGQGIWCTAQANVFESTFGFSPNCEWAGDTDPQVLDLTGSALRLTNSGGTIQLLDAAGKVRDTLLYGDESFVPEGWSGPAAQLYDRGSMPREGQVWRRKQNPRTSLPLDTDQASDWAGDGADLAWGRRVYMPGWDIWQGNGRRIGSRSLPETARVTVAIGPEGLYTPLAGLFAQAQSSIDLSVYAFEQPALADLLADAARRGVRVRLLLEGGPSGGITDLQRWCVARIAQAGGQVFYFAANEDAPRGYRPRYLFMHAKFGIVDGRQAFIGTDNFTLESMPVPENDRIAAGRRGVYLITDAPSVVEELRRIFAEDLAPQRFRDLVPFEIDHPVYGGPPPEFALPGETEPFFTDSPFREPVSTSGTFRFEVVSAPDTPLNPDSGMLALLNQAGPGDEILMTQLYEHKYWGDITSNPIADPNPRLQAILDAARRGAKVRVLLDNFFDDPTSPRSNRATAAYLTTIAAQEALDLQARLGNPTGLGIHAKILLVRLNGEYWSIVGSLNGSEASYKLNRETLLQTDAPLIYARLAEVFQWDWAHSQP